MREWEGIVVDIPSSELVENSHAESIEKQLIFLFPVFPFPIWKSPKAATRKIFPLKW